MMQRDTWNSPNQGATITPRGGERRGRGFPGALAGRVLVLASLLAGVALAGGCSAADCQPPVAKGTRYIATLTGEAPPCTMTGQSGDCSDTCHIVNGMTMSPFEVTAGNTNDSGTSQNCSTTPAETAPRQNSVNILSCIPVENEMLGVFCEMQYPNGNCRGSVNFHFEAANRRPLDSVDWNANVIDGLVFVIQDRSQGCWSGAADCRDVYFARLEKVK